MKPDRPLITRQVVLIATAVAAIARLELSTASAQELDAFAVAAVLEKAFTKTIAEAEPSVVSIARFKTPPPPRAPDPFNPLDAERRRDSIRDPASPEFIPNDFGTGIIVAPKDHPDERYILTNYHVVRGGPAVGDDRTLSARSDDFRLFVRFANRRGCEAQIYAADPRSDLAILQIDFDALDVKPADLHPIAFAPAPEFRKGQLVLSLGNPYAIARDGAASASWGMISNIGRRPAPAGPLLDEETRHKETIHHYGTLLHLDTRLNLGTSGGPVLNLRGELIGIAASLAALDGYEKSTGFAIPVDAATRRMIEDLMKGYEVDYGFLGVKLVDVDAETLRTRFPAVSSTGAAMAQMVIPQSPAARAVSIPPEPASSRGMQSGDLILAVNGQPVHGKYDLMRLIGLLEPDTRATLRIWREKPRRELQVEVTLGKWPVLDEEKIIACNSRWAWRGITIDYCTARDKYLDQNQNQYPAAVLVTKVAGKAGAAGTELAPGDFISHVNDREVRTPAEFLRAVEGLEGDATLTVIGAPGRRVVVRK